MRERWWREGLLTYPACGSSCDTPVMHQSCAPLMRLPPVQDPASSALAIFSVDAPTGVVPAQGELALELTLQPSRLGSVQVPVSIQVMGSRAKPLGLVMEATCIGPVVEFAAQRTALQPASKGAAAEDGASPGDAAAAGPDSGAGQAVEWSSTSRLAFGSVAVLQQHRQQLRVRNPTPVPARLKLSLQQGKESVFQVSWVTCGALHATMRRAHGASRHGPSHPQCLHLQGAKRLYVPHALPARVLQVSPCEAVVGPLEELALSVTAQLFDAGTFADVLRVVVADGADVSVPLEASGGWWPPTARCQLP